MSIVSSTSLFTTAEPSSNLPVTCFHPPIFILNLSENHTRRKMIMRLPQFPRFSFRVKVPKYNILSLNKPSLSLSQENPLTPRPVLV